MAELSIAEYREPVTSNGITGITGLSNLAGGGENDDPSFYNPCTSATGST